MKDCHGSLSWEEKGRERVNMREWKRKKEEVTKSPIFHSFIPLFLSLYLGVNEENNWKREKLKDRERERERVTERGRGMNSEYLLLKNASSCKQGYGPDLNSLSSIPFVPSRVLVFGKEIVIRSLIF